MNVWRLRCSFNDSLIAFTAKGSSDTIEVRMCRKSMRAKSTQIEAENLVVNVVALWATLLEEEWLCEFEWLILVAVDVEAASDEHKDSVVHRWLVVELGTIRVKSQVRKSTELLHDRLRSHELLSLVREHTLVGV